LKRLRYAASGADLFADPGSGFVYPKFMSAEVGDGAKFYERKLLSSDHDAYPGVVGEKEASLKMVTELIGFGGSPAGAGNGVAATDGENGLLLKSVFGKQTKDTGSQAAAGTTASVVKLASTTLFSVGGFVGCVDPATSIFHVRQIRSKNATDLNLCRALPFTPATSSVVYASAHYSHATEGHQHLWFDVEGYDATPAGNWRRYVRGALGNLALKLDGQATMEWDWKGVDWFDASGASQGVAAFPANMPAAGVFVNRRTRVVIDATEQKVTDLGFDLGNDVQAKAATSPANGISSFFMKDAKRGVKFSVYHDDGGMALITKFLAGTKIDLLIELSQAGPGNSFVLCAPFVELTGYKRKDQGGLVAYDFEAMVRRNDTITGVADVTLGVL
jgi:hypothetical protein